MGLYLPPELRWLGYVAGSEWPDGDETVIWEVAQIWHDAANGIRGVVPEVQTAKGQAVGAYRSGSGADSISQMFDEILNGDSSLDQLATYMDQLGDAANSMGTSVQSAKLMVIISLILLAIEIAWAWAFPPTAPAVEAAEVGATRLVVRFLGRMIEDQIVERVLRLFGEKFAQLAKGWVATILKGALTSGGVDAAVQLGEMAAGHQKNFNVNEFATSLLGGAAAGAGGKLFGDIFGKQSSKLFGDLSNTFARTGHGMLVGAAGGEFGNLVTDLVAAGMTGDWSGTFGNAAGWAGGAAHGVMSGGVRAFRGDYVPSGSFKFEVGSFDKEGNGWSAGFTKSGDDAPIVTSTGYRGGSSNSGGDDKLSSPVPGGRSGAGNSDEISSPINGSSNRGVNDPSNRGVNDPSNTGNSNGIRSTNGSDSTNAPGAPRSTPVRDPSEQSNPITSGTTDDTRTTPAGTTDETVSTGNAGGAKPATVEDSSSNGNVGGTGGLGGQRSTPSEGTEGQQSENVPSSSSSQSSTYSSVGAGDGTTARPTLRIDTSVANSPSSSTKGSVEDEVSPVSPVSPGSRSSLSDEPVSPIDEEETPPWSQTGGQTQSSSLGSNSGAAQSSPVESTSSPAAGANSSPTTSSSSPARSSGLSSSSTGGSSGTASGTRNPLAASSTGAQAGGSAGSTSSTATGGVRGAASTGDGSSPLPTRSSSLGSGSSSGTPSDSSPSSGGVRNPSNSSPSPSSTSSPSESTVTPGSRTGTGGGDSNSSSDTPLAPYGSRAGAGDSGSPTPGVTGGRSGSGAGNDDPTWKRNKDGTVTVKLPDGTEVQVQEGFVYVGTPGRADGGGDYEPHYLGRDGSVRLAGPNGSTVTVKPDGETETVQRGGEAKTKYQPDGTKIESAPGEPTRVTTPDGTEHIVPTDKAGWTRTGNGGFTVTSHDGTEHTIDKDGNIVIGRPGDEHGIKVSADGKSVDFVGPDHETGSGTGKSGRTGWWRFGGGKPAGHAGEQSFGRPDRTTHTVLPDGGGVRTTGPDGSTTTVKPDGSTEFTHNGRTTAYDPEGQKIESGGDEPTVVTKPDGTTHDIPMGESSWEKSGGGFNMDSHEGTTHTLDDGGKTVSVGRGQKDPLRFTLHTGAKAGESSGDAKSSGDEKASGSDDAKSGDKPSLIGSLAKRLGFGGAKNEPRSVDFYGHDDKPVKLEVSDKGIVKITNPDESTVTVRPDGSAEFVSKDGVKTGFRSGGKESGSKSEWADSDASWSKDDEGKVTITSPDGRKFTVSGEKDAKDISFEHPGDAEQSVTVKPDYSIEVGRGDTTAHTVKPDNSVETKTPEGVTTTVHTNGTMRHVQTDETTTVMKPEGTEVRTGPDQPTVVIREDGTEQILESDHSVKVTEPDGTTHTINDSRNPLLGRETTHPDGSRTTVAKSPDGFGLGDRITGPRRPEGVDLNRPDGTKLELNGKGEVKVTDPSGTTYEKTSGGKVKVTGPDGEEVGDKQPIESKGGTAKLSNGATIENTPDGFKVFHDDSVSEVGKSGVKFTDMEGISRETQPDGMIRTKTPPKGGAKYPDGDSDAEVPGNTIREVRPDGSVRVTEPDGTSSGSRPDGTSWTVDKDGMVHVNEPDGTMLPPVDRASPHLTGGQIVGLLRSRYVAPPQQPPPMEYVAPIAPSSEEMIPVDMFTESQPPPYIPPPPYNPPPFTYTPPPFTYNPPWSNNWDNYHATNPAGFHEPDMSGLNNLAGREAAGLGNLSHLASGLSAPAGLSARELAGLSNLSNIPGLSSLGAMNGLSAQQLAGLSGLNGLAGLSPSQLSSLSSLSPSQLANLAGLSPSELSQLSNLSPQQLAALSGMSPQQLAALSPAQLASLSPQQLASLASLSPQQLSALSNMSPSELASLSPQELSALAGMSPQQIAQLANMSPQQVQNLLSNMAGTNGGQGNSTGSSGADGGALSGLNGLQSALNSLSGLGGLNGLNDLAGNHDMSALTNALSGQNGFPGLSASDMLNSAGQNGFGGSDGLGSGDGSGGSGQGESPTQEYGPDAAKSMADVTNDSGSPHAGADGSGPGHQDPVQTEDPQSQHNPMGHGGAGSPGGGEPEGSPGAGGGRPSPEAEEAERKKDRKKKRTARKKRKPPKALLVPSPDDELAPEDDELESEDDELESDDDELESDDEQAPEYQQPPYDELVPEPAADVDVMFNLGNPAGAQTRSNNKPITVTVNSAPDSEPPGA
ncbi:hypothetical protein [Nocardia alni]|uniref:WXG100-like domain-containing protein n=1 Tax=Nocardia alni TaxID=2815723 RepID=UPI001C222AD1|nr:hypothetical protein [Nocardia alni]